jgi:alpha-L-rhamnosidase
MKFKNMRFLFFIFYSFLFFIVLISGCSTKSKKMNEPIHLQCEYQSNPLGIDDVQPRLFWQVNDTRRGAMQTAYQILVSSTKEKLSKNQADIWDSGKVDSDQSAHVAYQGPVLQSRKTYHWKVRTWDRKGVVSAYSAPAFWEMGILSANEWTAQWVGKEKIVNKALANNWPWKYWFWHPTEFGIDKPMYFRKRFSLPAGKSVASALMRLTADNNFSAYLNNEKIGVGDSWHKVYDFDVTAAVKRDNIIAIEAVNSAGTVCGLIFSLKVMFNDGSEMLIHADESDKNWKTTTRTSAGWRLLNYNDSQWQNIKLLADYNESDWGKIDPTEVYDRPQPALVRNEIEITKPIQRARVYVTGLGGYVMFLNGKRVGDAQFTPGWTHYPKRIQYQTYDVSRMLHKGKNSMGAVLGSLWWSSGFGWRDSIVYSEGPLRFMLQLVIDYKDGSSETFVTDETWKTDSSPILQSTLYHGEIYDARLEQQGWNESGFDDKEWNRVQVFEKEKATLVCQQAPLMRITKKIKPIKITTPSDTTFVFDMGQNFAGWAKLKVKGKRGTKIKLRFAETLQPDGNIYTENLRQAKATDTYILKGKGVEEWQPLFTYHGYRYVEVTGFPGTPTAGTLTGLVVNSDAPNIGEFSCSNEVINSVQHNILWAQASNMYSVPTDCPQRDERFGWMGDAQVFAPTASYNMNMMRFFCKWMNDVTDCQEKNGAVHNTNPSIVKKGPASPGWGDAVFVVPWVLYNFYGDRQIIEENYNAMAGWVDYMTSQSKGDLYEKDGYGDWIAVEESPSEPIGSAYYYYGAKVVSEMAGLLNKTEDQAKYEKLSKKIAKAFNNKHYDLAINSYTGDTQAANVLPLAFGIVPQDYEQRVAARIAKDVNEKGNHISTGLLGTSVILPTLSEFGYHELAWKIANQTTYPSWGHMAEKGATTIWELWNGDTAGPGMNSRNHFALGSCGEWYYSHLAGIRPTSDAPGFKKIILAPIPPEGLDWAQASIKTSYGLVSSAWRKNKKSIEYNFVIPANTTAAFHLPFLDKNIKSVMESNVLIYENGEVKPTADMTLLETGENKATISLNAGDYRFVVTYE